MKNKKLHIIFLVLAVVTPMLIGLIAVGLIRAWYTNVIQTGELNAETKNVAIKYYVNDSTKTQENITTYSISNLAFFDADSDFEGEYLEPMAFEIKLDITNNSTDAVSYKIEFESIKTILLDDEEEISVAYAACIFDSVEVSDTKLSVYSYIDSPGSGVSYNKNKTSDTDRLYVASKESSVNLAAGENASIYLYVFGIQEIDSALSTDFLYTNLTRTDTRSYQFKLSIIAEPKGSTNVTESQAPVDDGD